MRRNDIHVIICKICYKCTQNKDTLIDGALSTLILTTGMSKCLKKLDYQSNSGEKPEIEHCKRRRLRHVSLKLVKK